MNRKNFIGMSMAILAIIVIGILNHYQNDYYTKQISYTDYQPIQGTSELKEEDKSNRVWCEDDNSLSKIETGDFALEEGRYIVTVEYSSSSAKNTLYVSSEMAVNDMNDKGIVLAATELAPENNIISMELPVERLFLDTKIGLSCVEGEVTILNTSIKSQTPHFSDSILLAMIVCFIVLIVVLLSGKDKKERSDATIVVLLGTTAIVATFPFFNDFLIQGHDLYIHLARIEGLSYGMKYGEFPIRINPIQIHAYGYAMPIMYPDIFLYIPAILRRCGVSLMLSYKIFILLVNIATTGVAYQCFKNITKSKYIGTIASMLYVLGGYRLLNIYERAALGEVLAMIFLPLIMWSMYEVIKGNSKRWLWASVGYAGLFMSHILSFLMVAFFSILSMALFVPVMVKQKERIKHLSLAFIVTVLMTLGISIPFLSFLRLPFAIGSVKESLHRSSIYLSQVFTQTWRAGESVSLGQTKGEMPLSLGIILLVGMLFFLFFYVTKKQKENEIYKIGLFSFALGGMALFMASWIFPWELLQKVEWINRVVSKFQFSFRFLLVASVFWALTAAIGIALLFEKEITEKQLLLVASIIVVITMGFLDGTLEKETIPNKSQLVGTNTNDNLYMYEGINPYNWYLNGESIVVSNDASVQISDYIKRGTTIEFYATINGRTEDSYFELPLAYYPGYQAKMENEVLAVSMAENGILRIPMPSKSGIIVTEYKEKPVWLLADVISMFTWLAVASVGIKKVGWKKHEH